MKYLRRLPAMLLVIAVIVAAGFAWQETPAASLVIETKAAPASAAGQTPGADASAHAGATGKAGEGGAIPGEPPPGMARGAIEEKSGGGGDQPWPDLSHTGALAYAAKVLGGILLLIVVLDVWSRRRQRARRSGARLSTTGSATP
jgi:hypothetical protein